MALLRSDRFPDCAVKCLWHDEDWMNEIGFDDFTKPDLSSEDLLATLPESQTQSNTMKPPNDVVKEFRPQAV